MSVKLLSAVVTFRAADLRHLSEGEERGGMMGILNNAPEVRTKL